MKVKIYSTPQCHFCHLLKDYLKERGVDYEDIDVSMDHDAAMEMVEKTGQMGVPVTEINGDIVIGFDMPKLEDILSRHEGGEVMSRKHPGKTVEEKDVYDVIIVGGSAAGLTAAIYSTRREMKTLVIAKDIGGQVSMTTDVENYPGFEKIEGMELIRKFEKQAKGFGAEIIISEVTSIDEVVSGSLKLFSVHANGSEHFGKTVILATGKTPRSMNVPGEKEFTGKGVSYCVTCDAPLFRGKRVAVVGGGNSAFDAAILLGSIADKIYLIHRRDEFRAFENVVNEVRKNKKVEFVLDSIVEEIKGDKFVGSIIVANSATGERKEIEVDGVFVEIGSDVDTEFVKHLVELDDTKHIKTNKSAETSKQGVFAAGDVSDTVFKQIVVAAGEGCKAALAAYNYIHGFKNEYVIDWSASKNRDG